MPAVGIVSDLIVGRLFFDFYGNGFSENHYFNTTDYASAKADLALIAEARGALMPLNCNMVRATVSTLATTGDASWLTLTAKMYSGVLLDAEMTRESCNDPVMGLLFRFEDGLGLHTNRGVHCVRDGTIADFNKTLTPSAVAVGGPYPAVADAMTSADAWGNYLALVRDKTVKAKKLFVTPANWDLESYNAWVYSKTAKFPVGKSILVMKGKSAKAI